MKLNKIIMATALTLGGLLVLNSVAQAQEAKEGKKRGFSMEQRLERMTEQLKLTDAQKPKVKAVLEESQKKMEALRGQDMTPEQRREKFTAMREEEAKKLNAILTPEQQEKMKSMREEMRKKGGFGEKKGEGKKKTE
jgi:Spy/CpxP family protein refolding chaperone